MYYQVVNYVKGKLLGTCSLSEAWEIAVVYTLDLVDFDMWLESLISGKKYHYEDDRVRLDQFVVSVYE